MTGQLQPSTSIPSLEVGTRLGVLQGMLHPLPQSIPVNVKDVIHLAKTRRREGFLVDMDITVIGAAVGSIHVQED